MDYSQEPISVLSLCTGLRGLERGIERVIGPFRTIAYVEIEAAIIENLVVGMEAGKLAPAPIWANLKTFPWKHFRHKIFLLVGGYPCQPFSTAGKRKGGNDPRHLWPYIEGGGRTARPVCVFFENVLGHLSLGFDQVTDSLRAMGYSVEAGIYTASEVGAPHKRARIFILGILADAKDYVRGLYERQWRSGEETANVGGTSESMGNTNGIRWNNGAQEPRKFNLDEIGQLSICEERWNTVQRGVAMSGEDVADTKSFSERKQADESFSFPDGRETWAESCDGGWPSRPGRSQYNWEEPRTVESGMGCTIDGYNFREDLLRALGNGVVEDQSEFAFRHLLAKHFP